MNIFNPKPNLVFKTLLVLIAIIVISSMFCVTCFSQVTTGASASATIMAPVILNKQEDKGKDSVFEINQDFYYETLVTSDTISTIVSDKNKLYIKKEKNQTIIINFN